MRIAVAENNYQNKIIAPDEKYQIVCPYCFNEVDDGHDGFNKPFSHKAVEFRAETFFQNEAAIEKELGVTKIDIDMMADEAEQKKMQSKYELATKFMLKTDEKYQKFWDNYEGQTTEKDERMNNGTHQWERPVISLWDGISQLIPDEDGFVTAAVDVFGKVTNRRVCPHCHNPLPINFGKNKVKNISIIGTTGAGKTVYISQLLKGMVDYATKSGLSAFYTSPHEAEFVEDNMVSEGVPLPDSTSPGRLSQPMFYDIVQSDGIKNKREDTIVLYDIAGENCKDPNSMIRFAKFVKHSDGIILLIDPEQLNFVVNTNTNPSIVPPSQALNTLHSVLVTGQNNRCEIPMAVCVSKSDQCFDILPQIAQDQVQVAGEDMNGMPTREFDGKSYNQLQQDLKELMIKNAKDVCGILMSGYLAFNFFALSAIGCKCDLNKDGYVAPIAKPNPRRIEEPILWLFKQFGFIKSNTRVLRPFKIPHEKRYEYKKPLLGKAFLIQHEVGYSEYEEEQVRTVPQVLKKGEWLRMSEEFSDLPVKQIEE